MSKEALVYVGSYTQNMPFVAGKGEGIYLLRLDLNSGVLSPVDLLATTINPSYLAIAPNGKWLYAVQEVTATANPGVHAYAVAATSGALTHLNFQPSWGGFPCYVGIDGRSQTVGVVNYESGNITLYPVLDDGQLGAAAQVVQHHGSGPNPGRQEGPHTHMALFDDQLDLLFVPDLGLDKVFSYQLDRAQCRLTPFDPPATAVAPGSGPRHLVFHGNGRYAFIINELASTITVCDYAAGVLTPRQYISTLPTDYAGQSSTAAVKITPNGKFVYGSNRGHDSIAAFAFDTQHGQLSSIGYVSTQGQTPRDFAIDPTGQWLLAANQDTDSIVVFGIDQQTGELRPTGQIVDTPTPVCLQMVLGKL